jgi:hypothetical protein
MEGSLLDWQLGDLLPSCTAGDLRVSYAAITPFQLSVIGTVDRHGVVDRRRTTQRDRHPFGFVHEGAHSSAEMLDAELLDRHWAVSAARLAMVGWAGLAAYLMAQLLGFRWPSVFTFAAAALSGAGSATGMVWAWGTQEGSAVSDVLSSDVRRLATASAALCVLSVLTLAWVLATVWKLPWDRRPRGIARLVRLYGWRETPKGE